MLQRRSDFSHHCNTSVFVPKKAVGVTFLLAEMETGPDSGTEETCQPLPVEAQPQQDPFSSDISRIPIENTATDTIFCGPMETRACMSMVANANSLPVIVCVTLVSLLYNTCI